MVNKARPSFAVILSGVSERTQSKEASLPLRVLLARTGLGRTSGLPDFHLDLPQSPFVT
jgi:hypothetical protein